MYCVSRRLSCPAPLAAPPSDPTHLLLINPRDPAQQVARQPQREGFFRSRQSLTAPPSAPLSPPAGKHAPGTDEVAAEEFFARQSLEAGPALGTESRGEPEDSEAAFAPREDVLRGEWRELRARRGAGELTVEKNIGWEQFGRRKRARSPRRNRGSPRSDPATREFVCVMVDASTLKALMGTNVYRFQSQTLESRERDQLESRIPSPAPR